MAQSVIPFGPQHPVLPEPLSIKLVLQDEKVVEAIPAIGYVHRGLEKLTEVKDFNQNIFVVERICGICSFIHAMAYCQGIEEIMNVTIPDRARYLRVVWGELHRTHSHLLWLGLMADAFGLESLFMEAWKCREKVMDIMEATAGSRVIISTNTIGGVRRDIDNETLKDIAKAMNTIADSLKKMEGAFLNDYTVKHRLCGVGVLTKEQAYQLGAVGPMARGSGIAQDYRMLGYAAYNELDFKPVVTTEGDSWARTWVRINEIYQSAELINKVAKQIPDGDINVPVRGNPNGEVVVRVEQPRGELLYYIKANGTKNLSRVRVRTPTFANIPPLLSLLPGHELPDVPVLILSIDPCISCTER